MNINLKEIRYYSKNTYGNVFNYPIDYVVELETLTGMKTLAARNIKALEGMGFSFVEVLESTVKKGG